MFELEAMLEPETLPAEVTSFVGRRAERTEVRTLLAESRLVTLTGFGGVGKTRLALRLAADLRRAFPDGVHFVPLGSLTDPDWLPDHMAAALGLQPRSTRAATSSLMEYLYRRSALLILDNCEHVVDAAARMADTTLRTCPKVRVLATSREPLRIPGETVHPVSPLTAPVGDESSGPATQYESVSLFLDRAKSSVPWFALDDENRDAVIAICRKLEGIPLAIELAAGRLRAMSAGELADNLTDRWELLNRGSRVAPGRQRTMADCIDWSFDLCTEAERDLWATVSVFAEGFDLEGAHSVCGDQFPAVTDNLLSLVDKSLVTALGSGRRTRFRMLPPLRQRGLSRLQETGELTAVRRRHRDWILDLAIRSSQEWLGPRQVEWIQRLRQEGANLTEALEFCFTEPGEAEPGLRIGGHLLEFGLADGLFRPGLRWFDKLLPLAPERTETRAMALRTATFWAAMQGDLDHALPLLEEGESIADELGGRVKAALTHAAAFVAMFRGEVDEAAELFEEAAVGCRAHGDASQAAHAYLNMALNYVVMGDFDRAWQAHESCLAITEPAGEQWYRLHSLWIAGLTRWGAGSVTEGVDLQKQSLRLKLPMNDRLGIATSLEAIAWMVATTDPKRAAMLFGAAQNEWGKIETSPAVLPSSRFHVRAVQQAHDALGEAGYQAAFEAGQAMSRTEAVEFALEEKRAPRTPQDGVAHQQSVLTRREREIADLVAKGMKNKDIADTLVISTRTAEAHVEHILTKLGFTSRHQIAAWVIEHSAR